MALREVPQREQQLDDIYTRNNGPGVRAYVFGRLAKGDDVKAISQRFSDEHSIVLPSKTLYDWLRRWRREAKAKRETKEQNSKTVRLRRQPLTKPAQPDVAEPDAAQPEEVVAA